MYNGLQNFPQQSSLKEILPLCFVARGLAVRRAVHAAILRPPDLCVVVHAVVLYDAVAPRFLG